jgi:hypothetical protein
MSTSVSVEDLHGDWSHNPPNCSRRQATPPKRDVRCSNLREQRERERESDLEQTTNEHEDSEDGDNRVEAH